MVNFPLDVFAKARCTQTAPPRTNSYFTRDRPNDEQLQPALDREILAQVQAIITNRKFLQARSQIGTLTTESATSMPNTKLLKKLKRSCTCNEAAGRFGDWAPVLDSGNSPEARKERSLTRLHTVFVATLD